MREAKLLKSLLLLLAVTLTSCNRIVRIESEDHRDVELESDLRNRNGTNKETIKGFLAEIWISGFLIQNELIEREILNNEYGLLYPILTKLSPSPKDWARYIKEGYTSKVLLNEGLFSSNLRLRIGLNSLHEEVKSILVHELFHDFWHNLLDPQKKFLFSIEAEIFFLELIMAKTQEDKVRFLSNAGLNEPSEDDFIPFEELERLKKYYRDQKFFGTELYSIIADRAFSGKMVIPKQLRKFYSGILSELALNKNSI